MLTYRTAGESHGRCIAAIVEGIPAGLPIDTEAINGDLRRRQSGYGRGGRMKIEQDSVDVLSGVRHGQTIGGPVLLVVHNRDFKIETLPPVHCPRPGHGDLAGAMKYDTKDARDILERASARETAGRVAAGSLAKTFLAHFGIACLGHVIQTGRIRARAVEIDPARDREKRDANPMHCLDDEATQEMIAQIENARRAGDTLGGVIEVVVTGAPPGLGAHVSWQTRLDARLAAAAMGVQAMKGVEIGMGFDAAERLGSEAHDEILPGDDRRPFTRPTNNAGGIEAGMSNGEPIVLRAAMKPIPTLMRPLRSVDLVTKETTEAAAERSDACAVPAAAIVLECVVAFEIARAFLEKFAGDTLNDTLRAFDAYCERIGWRA